MKKFAENKVTLIIASISLVGSCIWSYKTHFDYEPVILFFISAIEIIAYFILSGINENSGERELGISTVSTAGNVSLSVIVNTDKSEVRTTADSINKLKEDRESQIDHMKPRTKILFIDDDKNFNVVRILKDSGWKNTKSVVDLKSIDIPLVKETDIFFVDINGVGTLLNLEAEGLDLALMLKQKFPQKKVVIYFANRTSNSFHEAWNLCDFKLEKNALPYQFQNLVEQYSLQLNS
jgi:hypothetical protein